MSDKIGPMAWGSQGQVFLGEDLMHTRDYSEHTSQVIDDEVELILRAQEQRALEVLARHRGGLDAVARALLDEETIDGETVGRLVDTAYGRPGARRRCQVRPAHLRRQPARPDRLPTTPTDPRSTDRSGSAPDPPPSATGRSPLRRGTAAPGRSGGHAGRRSPPRTSPTPSDPAPPQGEPRPGHPAPANPGTVPQPQSGHWPPPASWPAKQSPWPPPPPPPASRSGQAAPAAKDQHRHRRISGIAAPSGAPIASADRPSDQLPSGNPDEAAMPGAPVGASSVSTATGPVALTIRA